MQQVIPRATAETQAAPPRDASRDSDPKGVVVWLLPAGLIALLIAVWAALSATKVLPDTIFPTPLEVVRGFQEELRAGRLFDDITASLWRTTVGFILAALTSVPLGVWMGRQPYARITLLPIVNFFRSLSPLAWIPFAVFWFHLGDPPAIFLVFLATFFPLVIAVMGAVASIPSVYFQVAEEYGFRGWELLVKVTLPAIMPQVITALRVAAGISWIVVVAAEMLAGKEGLGFAVWDARNGLRMDLLVCEMVVIGIIGMILDRVLLRLTRLPGVRWGYER